VAVSQIDKHKVSRESPLNFEKLMKSSCCTHGYPVKHAFKDCDLLKCYLKGEYEPADGRKPDEPAGDKEEDTFPD
jgi:hypothetical protein